MTTLTNENREIVVLTDAEIELINLKREEDRLAAEKEVLNKKIMAEKAMAITDITIKKIISNGEAQVDATRAYFQKLVEAEKPDTTKWKLIIKEQKRTHDSSWMLETPIKKEYWVLEARIESIETYTVNYSDNVSSYPRFIINVNKYVTDGGMKWSYKTINHGYRMFLSGRGIEYAYERKALKNVKPILAKVTSIRNVEAYKKNEATKKISNVERVINEMKALYPTALVEPTTGYSSYEKESVTYVKVSFPNGVTLKLKAFAEGFFIQETLYPSNYNVQSYITELSELKLVRN